MRKIERTSQFRRDYKREARGQHRASLDANLVPILVAIVRRHCLFPRDLKFTADVHSFLSTLPWVGRALGKSGARTLLASLRCLPREPFKFADNPVQLVDKRRPACLDEDIEH